ncbi:hypothetical protein ACGFX4_21440 [Kitasatospora sp. NPDC048365]|uniref:hypothetical protein n=1 Tax=Kitasatospora sp. NPDC048365 TaxID=3364050 RepID=UPI003715407A
MDGARSIDLPIWNDLEVPLLRTPREFVAELHQRHLPQPGTTVVAVLDPEHRVTASASFATRPHITDGWHHRNALLAQLRRVVPHDLRLSVPVRTAVLLRCREGSPEWTEQDGAWMWALRDAAELHGLRCGSYLTLTPAGWHSIGDGRRGRNPHSGSWADGPIHTVTELPPRPVRELARELGRQHPVGALPVVPVVPVVDAAPVATVGTVTALDSVRRAAGR